jgi:two-component system NtrC family response regulator
VDVVGSDRAVSVDVRIVAATNQDLESRVREGGFREDLYFRLNVIEIKIPPLRDRVEDIPELAKVFVQEFAQDRELAISEESLEELRGRAWPGNVRELRNACERMVVLSDGDTIRTDVLPDVADGRTGDENAGSVENWLALPPDGFSLLDLEKGVIERVLKLKGGNISEAARYLRVPRHILVYRIEKYGIARPSRR